LKPTENISLAFPISNIVLSPNFAVWVFIRQLVIVNLPAVMLNAGTTGEGTTKSVKLKTNMRVVNKGLNGLN